MTQSKANSNPTQFIQTDDGTTLALEVTLACNPRGSVVIVHGLGEHRGRYDEVVERLHREGLNVIRYDHRGHGDSSGRRGHATSYTNVLDDLDLLLSETSDVRQDHPTLLYGQSFGGAVVLNYLMRRPHSIHGAVVTSPLIKPVNEPSALLHAGGTVASAIWPTLSFSIGVRVEQLTHDAKMIEEYKRDTKCHRRVTARLGLHMLRAGEWLLDNADSLEQPVLLMHGVQDHVTSHTASAQFAASAGPNCEFVEWPDQFHELHHERGREEVLDVIANWIVQRLDRPIRATG